MPAATWLRGLDEVLQEAQTLGCTIVASDYNGNREQIEDGVHGVLCPLTREGIADSIEPLLRDEDARKRLGAAAAEKDMRQGEQIQALLELMN